MNEYLVKCCKAGIDDYCRICEHGDPHEPDEDCILGVKCTTWGECNLQEKGMVKVRCTRLKEENDG